MVCPKMTVLLKSLR